MKQVSMDVKAFIIPSSISCLDERPFLYDKSERIAFVRSICEFNKISIPIIAETPMVPIWWHCEQSDNICDHGLRIDGVPYRIRTISLVPVAVFSNRKEGETFNLRFIANCYEDSRLVMDPEEIEFDWNVTLDQLNFRYHHFGPFEKVLQDLIDAYK